MFFFNNEKVNTFGPRSIEHAYTAILCDELETAKQVFKGIDSPRAKWGKALTDIISGYIENYPSYFEIRNFLEIDLEFLIKNEKIDYVEMVLGSLDLLADINQEVYKYAARVMFENKFYKSAEKYLQKSVDVFYNDPEIHFMYARFYLNTGNFKKADFHLTKCSEILPDYFPAKILKKEIAKHLD